MKDLEERKSLAVKEILTLLDLYEQEEKKITEELKRTGKFKYGLDTNSESYVALNREFDKKIAKVFAKYNLSSGTKLKLW